MVVVLLMIEILHYLMDLNYGNYGIILIMGNAGVISSTVGGVGSRGILSEPQSLGFSGYGC